ncbi:MAG: SWIM zinc finger family protein [Ideonella sp.]|nr:SWIM zinc finger family protein [Ideonella sp.]
MSLSTDAVLAMAPDDSSVKAARGLMSPAKWPLLGHDAQAVWGECQGSGSKPYQTQVDLAGPAFRCSCPSRKFPCKHGLALLLMRCDGPERFTATEQPAWVQEWLNGRQDKAEKKAAKQEQKSQAIASPEDEAASAQSAQQRQDKRWARIDAGLTELERWLSDLLRQGLASVQPSHRAAWQAFAARMVDAQAPGAGQALLAAAETIGEGPDWPQRLLAQLGRLQLRVDALRQREHLSPAELADLRVALGWPLDRDDVAQQGERIADRWTVLAQITEEKDRRLQERRVWLWGERSARMALVLDFAHAQQGFEQAWLTGTALDTSLLFAPSHQALRAWPEQPPAPEPSSAWPPVRPPALPHPWQPLAPVVLQAVVQQGVGEPARWLAHTAEGRWPLDLSDDDAWVLRALCGGHGLALMGEWDGQLLRPLRALSPEGEWHLQSGGHA